MRMRRILLAILLLGVAGCASPAEAPAPPLPRAVTAIRVVPLAPATGAPYEIADRLQEILSSYAFSDQGWRAAGRRVLHPLYRLELQDGSRTVATYWLGTNSHPAQFPCFSFCSGWWAGGASAPDMPDRYKPLPEATALALMRPLRL